MNGNKQIGFTCSTFDLLHAGHIAMLREAKEHCDYLIVGLQNDPTQDRPEKNKPVQTIVERQIQLAAIKYIDEIVIYNTTGAVGAARAAGLTDKDFSRFGKNISKNDHVMTFKPIENKAPYQKAYQNWKIELEKHIKK